MRKSFVVPKSVFGSFVGERACDFVLVFQNVISKVFSCYKKYIAELKSLVHRAFLVTLAKEDFRCGNISWRKIGDPTATSVKTFVLFKLEGI